MDDTLYTMTWQTGGGGGSNAILTKFDTNGNYITEYPLQDTTDLIIGYKGFFQFGQKFIGFGQTEYGTEIWPLAFQFDRAGNIDWIKNYPYPGSELGLFDHGIIGNGDTSFVFVGLTQSSATGWDCLITKTDTNGNLVNEFAIVRNNDQQAFAIDRGVDSGYVISGYSKEFDPSGDHVIFKIPESTGVTWEKQVGISGEYNGGMVFSGDSVYWIVGSWNILGANHARVSRLDKSGAVIDQIVFDDLSMEESSSFWGTACGDSYFTAVGGYQYNTGTTNIHGFILKVDSNCNEVWNRKLDLRTSNHLLFDIIEVNNGYVACGWVGADGTGTTQDLWVVGLDTLGCDSLGCHTVDLGEFRAEISTDIFPNPSDGVFTLSVSDFVQNGLIQITSASGKLVAELEFTGQQTQVDLSHVEAGIYFCTLSDTTGILGQTKLVLTK